ncbi:hypothetical protein D5041_01105 [Verminephrobacter aporrectodeae subsp. tuberculatae]|nr:hypothetical protein [Verminephrobacter aporrectodeae subsp. tuberculatae]MCW5287703.1 hypothetical protein [Verminephrobacter aporrectodeae subsp. tuberculatae]
MMEHVNHHPEEENSSACKEIAMKANVNLLDCSREPSDEQLEDLMRDVAAEARAKATLANTALRNTLAAQTAEVRARYHLPVPRAVALAAR